MRYSHRLKYLHADLRNKHYCEWIEFLKSTENWDEEKIAEYQLSEIKRIVNYAYENTIGYRKLYDSYGIKPSAIKTIEEFQKLPLITKETIRDNFEAFSVKMKGRKYITTGGSTGTPFGFYRDKIAFARELASKAYQYYRVGWKEGDSQLTLRGLVVPSKNHIRYYPRFNELRCSSYHLTPEFMELYRQRAYEFEPKWIRCYPSSGYIFAKFLKETGKPFPPVEGILCASENLYQYQKELLSKVFNARVFSHYGHYEMAVLAGFCEHEDTYHVLPQYGYAELVDKNGNLVSRAGEVGEIVGTSFIMHATPFIRYRTGDLAKLKGWDCSSCGRPYQIWESIEGRLQEFIVTSTGRYISMTSINMHDDIFDHIKQFQFYQEQKGRAAFRFIPKNTCNNEVVNDMKRRLMVKLGDDVELEMEAVDEIPLTSRGKHRFLIQKVNIEFGD
ncbi:MAG: phenylacetate--CoA ligase family protein [Candidatus Bathyarchaeota archaeon]|nr:phenylacetate--CoA ligase family protein [Candidatus Bathyarchaeota archaeon]